MIGGDANSSGMGQGKTDEPRATDNGRRYVRRIGTNAFKAVLESTWCAITGSMKLPTIWRQTGTNFSRKRWRTVLNALCQ